MKKLANGVSRLVVDGVGEVLEYAGGKMKVLVSANSKWITSTTGWTYVSEFAGPYYNNLNTLIAKGKIKVYKKVCGGASARTINNVTDGDVCEIGFVSVVAGIKEYFNLGSRKKGKTNRNPDIDKPRNSTDFLDTDAIYHVDGFKFETDASGRVKKVTADNLELNNGFREREGSYQEQIQFQNNITGNDDGGHLIANWFKGPNEAINIVPMSKGLNRNAFDPTLPSTQPPGAWLAMEREWAAALKATPKKNVSVEIEVKYGADRRPTRFDITYTINGIETTKTFRN
jgi:hypothetical protein